MIKALVTDLSRVLLSPKNKSYKGSLNALHKKLSIQKEYKLREHFDINLELLSYYKSLSDTVSLFLFTSETIQESPELQPFLQPVFKAVYSALKMRINKKDPTAYRQLASLIELAPDEIVYIDDSQVNIEAAKKVGFSTIMFQNNESLKAELGHLL